MIWRRAGLVAGLMVVALAPSAQAAPLQAGVAKADITPAERRHDVRLRPARHHGEGRPHAADGTRARARRRRHQGGAALDRPRRRRSRRTRSSRGCRTSASRTRRSSTRARTRTRGPTACRTGRSSSSRARSGRRTRSACPVRAAWGAGRVLDVNRNRSIEAHLANHGLDMFYGQGDPTDDPKGAEHARDTRLRILRVDRLDGTPLAGWIHFPVHLTTSAPGRRHLGHRPRRHGHPPPRERRRRAGLHRLLYERRAGRPDAALRLLQPHRGDGPARQADRGEGDARVAGRREAPGPGRRRRRALDALVLLRPGGRARATPSATRRSGGSRSSAGRRTARRSSTRRSRPRAGGCRRTPHIRCTGARSSSRAGSCTSWCRRCRSSASATGCCSARRASRASRWGAASRRPSGRSCRPGSRTRSSSGSPTTTWAT